MTSEQSDAISRALGVIRWVEAGGMPSDGQIAALAKISITFLKNSTSDQRRKFLSIQITHEVIHKE